MSFNLTKKTRAELIELFVALDQRCSKLYEENIKLRGEIEKLMGEIDKLQNTSSNNKYTQIKLRQGGN